MPNADILVVSTRVVLYPRCNWLYSVVLRSGFACVNRILGSGPDTTLALCLAESQRAKQVRVHIKISAPSHNENPYYSPRCNRFKTCAAISRWCRLWANNCGTFRVIAAACLLAAAELAFLRKCRARGGLQHLFATLRRIATATARVPVFASFQALKYYDCNCTCISVVT
jgi:hypothetical protein